MGAGNFLPLVSGTYEPASQVEPAMQVEPAKQVTVSNDGKLEAQYA